MIIIYFYVKIHISLPSSKSTEQISMNLETERIFHPFSHSSQSLFISVKVLAKSINTGAAQAWSKHVHTHVTHTSTDSKKFSNFKLFLLSSWSIINHIIRRVYEHRMLRDTDLEAAIQTEGFISCCRAFCMNEFGKY